MRSTSFCFFKWHILLLALVLTSNCHVLAQSLTDTTYQVPEVLVTASRNQYFGNDIKTNVYTKEELNRFEGESLSRFLMSNAAVNVKAYGAGGALSNITLRGTSTSHVQVNWNGFPINSATLGSCDFSMIPAGGFDRVSMVYGASGALYGSGTFGGAINLDSYLKPGKRLNGSVQAGYQSLKTKESGFSLAYGTSRIAWQVNAWGADSENDFEYYDYIKRKTIRQTDGSWKDAGMIQSFLLKLNSKSSLEAGLWAQIKAYDIPSHIGSRSYENQKDSTLKFFAAFKTHGDRWGLQLKAASFSDVQHYWQKASPTSDNYSIDSRIAAVQRYGDANFRFFIQPHMSLDAGVIGTYITADVSAYGKPKEEKGLAAFTGIKYDKDQLSWQAAIRKEWNSNFYSGFMPSFGVAWQLIPAAWLVRANISEKFRKPTFNDRFWTPGGNPDLKPETGYTIEAGTNATLVRHFKTLLTTDLTFYTSKVKDMIVWRPAGSYWMPRNYQRVRSVGLEANVLLDTRFHAWSYRSSVQLTLNRSLYQTGPEKKEQVMLYSPRVITNWKNQLQVGVMDFTLWHHFTADRFYDENALLKPYQTMDFQLGTKIPLRKGTLGTYATVYNMLDTTYELIRLYPIPGRYWTAKINYAF